MNLKRYLRLGVAAIVVAALGVSVSGCQPPENVGVEQSGAGQPESDQLAAVDMKSRERNEVGGSYGKNGVAPFGMAQRLPKQVDGLAAETDKGDEAASTVALLSDQNALFGVHCIACHGADGLGVEPLGVTLVGSPFIKSKSTEELVAMLKVGRMPDSADSVKGRVMPGFAWMSGEQLIDLAGFLKAQNP